MWCRGSSACPTATVLGRHGAATAAHRDFRASPAAARDRAAAAPGSRRVGPRVPSPGSCGPFPGRCGARPDRALRALPPPWRPHCRPAQSWWTGCMAWIEAGFGRSSRIEAREGGRGTNPTDAPSVMPGARIKSGQVRGYSRVAASRCGPGAEEPVEGRGCPEQVRAGRCGRRPRP